MQIETQGPQLTPSPVMWLIAAFIALPFALCFWASYHDALAKPDPAFAACMAEKRVRDGWSKEAGVSGMEGK